MARLIPSGMSMAQEHWHWPRWPTYYHELILQGISTAAMLTSESWDYSPLTRGEGFPKTVNATHCWCSKHWPRRRPCVLAINHQSMPRADAFKVFPIIDDALIAGLSSSGDEASHPQGRPTAASGANPHARPYFAVRITHTSYHCLQIWRPTRQHQRGTVLLWSISYAARSNTS